MSRALALALAVFLGLALAGCQPKSPEKAAGAGKDAFAVSVPGPDRSILGGALPTPELDGVVTAAGGWRLDRDAIGPGAIFSGPGDRPIFAMRCDRRHGVLIFTLAGASGSGGRLKIVTGSGAASYAAQPRSYAPGVMAQAPITDSFVHDALARASGRIGVKLDGAPTVAMPADPALSAVVMGCDGRRTAQSS